MTRKILNLFLVLVCIAALAAGCGEQPQKEVLPYQDRYRFCKRMVFLPVPAGGLRAMSTPLISVAPAQDRLQRSHPTKSKTANLSLKGTPAVLRAFFKLINIA